MPEISLTLGQCDKNSSGPGVSCMTSIKMSPQAQPLDRVVGFAKTHPENGSLPSTSRPPPPFLNGETDENRFC